MGEAIAASARRGPTLAMGAGADPRLVQALQCDLGDLGYFTGDADGRFAAPTRDAVIALQLDLLAGTGVVTGFNRGRVGTADGIVDDGLVDCIAELIAAPGVAKLPRAADPQAANIQARAAIALAPAGGVPAAFLLALLDLSGLEHFRPGGLIRLVLERGDDTAPQRVIARRYGIGGYRLDHHPPATAEVAAVIVDPVGNAGQAAAALRAAFDALPVRRRPRGVPGSDDRDAEHPLIDLRPCRYPPQDARYLRDCRACAAAVGTVDVTAGAAVYYQAALTYLPTAAWPIADRAGVPQRAEFLCDWPYAIRRAAGGGIDSYHAQAAMLQGLLRPLAGD